MKSIIEYIQEKLGIVDISKPILEMSTICKYIKWGNYNYRIAIHGPSSKDRDYPHIHIYFSDDVYPYKKFNFEISLIDILCYDEINLICQQDKYNKINIKNRNKCSWSGYRKIRNGFEEWLFDKPTIPGDFIDNLDAIIYEYNNESPYNIENKDENYLLEYIKDHGKKVLPQYLKYFNK